MKGIIKFYHKNKKISNIGIVAFVICISYIVTYNMPDYLGIEPFYSFLNNISISYLAAVIFYVVQVYIPSEEDEKKSLEILKPKFQQLIEFVEITILVYQKFVKIKDKGVNIEWTENDKIYFRYHKVGTEKSNSPRCYTKQDMLNLQNTLKKHLNDIRESSVFRYCEYDVVHEISQLEECGVFNNFALMVLLADTEISFANMDDGINKMSPHIEYIKKKIGIDGKYELEDIESGDRVIADITRGNIAENLKSIEVLNRKIYKERIKDQIKEQAPELPLDDTVLEEIMEQIYDKK